MAKSTVQLSEQKGKGFKICCGAWISEDGNRKPKTFYLGDDKRTAGELATRIRSKWIAVKASNPNAVWSVGDLAEIGIWKNGGRLADAVPSSKTELLYDLFNEYLADMEIRERAKKVCAERVICARWYLTKYLTRYLKNIPINSVGLDYLNGVTATLCERPHTRFGKPISVKTVLNLFTELKMFFKWARIKGKWQEPMGYADSDVLNCDAMAISTPQERERKIPFFTLDELKTIYQALPTDGKLYLLLSLNCGFCSKEIHTLRHSEIHLDDERPYIERLRTKTFVMGRWELWQETAELLRKHLKPNVDGWALLDRNGKPYALKPARTGISKNWDYWYRTRCPQLPWRPFKYCRKTGAQLVRELGGIEISEAYLSHSEKSMARFYSRPPQQRIDDTLRQLRQRLQPMFDGAEPFKMRLAV